jgi:hypothetical protein
MDRPAHDTDAHGRAVEQRLLQLGWRETRDPGTERHVRIARHLCLQADEQAHDVERRPVCAFEQQLARQRGAVQLAVGEDGAQLPVVEKCW